VAGSRARYLSIEKIDYRRNSMRVEAFLVGVCTWRPRDSILFGDDGVGKAPGQKK